MTTHIDSQIIFIPLLIWFKDKKAEKKEGSDLYFRDGVRRIDYVLAYRIGEGEKDARREQKRTEFEKSLKEEGIEIEKEDPQVWF